MNIVGRSYNEELPLFCQLYILKQVMSFYHIAYAMFFMPAIGINLSVQTAYYLFMNRYMYRQKVKLFSLPRVLFVYGLIHICHEEFFIKRYLMNSYRVNINDLFDQDEPFLFSSLEFKRLVKRMQDKYAHLVNQNFDLSAITQDPALSLPTEAEKKQNSQEIPLPYTSEEVVKLFNKTFNVSGLAHNPFAGMLEKYQKIFKGEIESTNLHIA